MANPERRRHPSAWTSRETSADRAAHTRHHQDALQYTDNEHAFGFLTVDFLPQRVGSVQQHVGFGVDRLQLLQRRLPTSDALVTRGAKTKEKANDGTRVASS